MMYYDCIGMSPMMIVPILMILGLLFLIYSFFNKEKPKNSLDMLKFRYANGEITKEEYYEIRKNIL